MKTARLGKTGLTVSRVGMGGIPITRPPEEEAINIVRRAIDLGMNFFDTSIAYKDSEVRIGKGIAGHRDKVVIATKGGGRDKATTQQHVEWSLQRLGVNYIDIWQFHGINSIQRLESVLQPNGPMKAAQEALKAGKIGHIGFSSHNLDTALKAVSSGQFETVQFPLNFVANEAVDKLVPLAKECGVGYISMKPFAGGRIRKASLAMKYLLQFDNVVPDPGVQKIQELEEIIEIVNGGWNLSTQDLKEIQTTREHIGKRFCHQCEYCMPCSQGLPPKGVFIPGVMYLKILWELWPPDWFLSWDYVKGSVESYKNCVQCGECEKKCPYQLPVREMMAENIEFYRGVAEKETDMK